MYKFIEISEITLLNKQIKDPHIDLMPLLVMRKTNKINLKQRLTLKPKLRNLNPNLTQIAKAAVVQTQHLILMKVIQILIWKMLKWPMIIFFKFQTDFLEILTISS
jgi:hypothetical protein